MNFDHTQEELNLFSSLEATLGNHPEASPKDLISLLAATNYTTLGSGDDASALSSAQERLAQWSPAAYRTIEYGLRIAAPTMARFGPEAWATTWIKPIQKGKILATAAFEAPPQGQEITATAHNDGYHLTGTKAGIPGAMSADVILTTGTADGAPALFLIEKKSSDITLTKKASGFSTLTAHGAFLPAAHVAILDKKAPLPPFLNLRKQRVQIGEATGHAAAAFELAKKRAKSHPEGEKPPIAKQEIGFKLATMYTLLQTSRLMAANASTLIDSGSSEAAMACSCARVFCSDAAQEIVTTAIEVMGEEGLEAGGPADRFNAIQTLRVAGTSVGQSKEAIGNMLLKY